MVLMSLCMGFSVETPGASAVDESQDADLDGELDEEGEELDETDEGLESLSDEERLAAEQAQAEADKKKLDEEEANKGITQKNFADRIAEIQAKNDAKLAEAIQKLEAKVQERQQAEVKPFVDLTPAQVDQINANYLDAVAHKAELELAVKEGDRSPQILAELRKAEKWISDTETWYRDNEAKKTEWTAKQGEVQKMQAEQQEKATRLQTTSDVFREARNIPQDVWDQASIWFSEQLKGNKELGLKFQAAYQKGDVHAVEFAHDYCTEHMGKGAEEALKAKEAAKTKLAPGVSGTNVAATQGADMKMLRELYAKAQKSGEERDLSAFTRAKAKAGITGSIFAKR